MTVTARIIKDSISPQGVRLTTMELEYPRLIHSEFMTHRMFSRNAASSRAIPVKSMIEMVRDNPAEPVHWGKNQPGMQAQEELPELTKNAVKALWKEASKSAASYATVMDDSLAHKQVVNRVLEPFQHVKVVVTATEWNNWFWLRNHKDADPTIKALAERMLEVFEASKPESLQPGEWHLPYVESVVKDGTRVYLDTNGVTEIDVETAKKVSVSSAAQVSYRKTDHSVEKALSIYSKLIESEPCHASPVEHIAQCIITRTDYTRPDCWPEGITHVDRNGQWWSGNLRGWVQFRQLIPNNVKYN